MQGRAADFVRATVQARAGIVLGPDKDRRIDSRLAPVARRLGFADAVALVEAAPRVPSRADDGDRRDARRTNEAPLFRDARRFRELARTILATHLSATALARAQAVRYSAFEVQRGLPPAQRLRHRASDGDY